MSEISRLVVAWVSTQQRHFQSSTRGIATVEQRLAWEAEAEQIIAVHDEQVRAEAYQRGHEDGFWNGKTTDMSSKEAAAFMAPYRSTDPTEQIIRADERKRVAEEIRTSSIPLWWKKTMSDGYPSVGTREEHEIREDYARIAEPSTMKG